MYTGFFIILIIVFIIFSFNKRKNNEDDLSKDSSSYIKGLLALGILFHHISQALDIDNIITHNFVFFGNLFVGAFFFFSGYGLIKSFAKDPKKYKKNFISKRFVSIVIPYIIISFITYIIEYALGFKYSFILFLKGFINFSPFVSLFWYIYIIVILYLVFYILINIFKNEKIISYITFILTCITVYICMKKGISYWWYHGIIPFGIGMLYYCYESKINSFVNPRYVRCMILFIVMFFLSTYLLIDELYYLPYIKSILLETIQILSLTFLLIFTFNRYELKLKIFNLLGNISYEIYLTQALSLFITGKILYNINSNLLFMGLAIIITIFISFIFNKFNTYITKLCFKK